MLGKLNTTIKERNGYMVCTLWNTDIVEWNDFSIQLDNGGYETLLTCRRMNQVAEDFNLNYRVYRKEGRMYVEYPIGTEPTKFQTANENTIINLERK